MLTSDGGACQLLGRSCPMRRTCTIPLPYMHAVCHLQQLCTAYNTFHRCCRWRRCRLTRSHHVHPSWHQVNPTIVDDLRELLVHHRRAERRMQVTYKANNVYSFMVRQTATRANPVKRTEVFVLVAESTHLVICARTMRRRSAAALACGGGVAQPRVMCALADCGTI
jgi:hypothetical protein